MRSSTTRPPRAGAERAEVRPLPPGDLRDIYDDIAADEALPAWTFHSYPVIYRPDARPLQAVRVLSGYRDIAALLE